MTIRIHAVTPIEVSKEELRRRRVRYAAMAPEGVTVELDNLPGGPQQLDSAAACRQSEEMVVEALRRGGGRPRDAVMADCVLDPGLERLAASVDVPAFGILQLATGALAAAGHRFGAVARNQAIADELTARVRAHGHLERFTGVRVLDLSLEDIADNRRWNSVLDGPAAAFADGPTSVILNGCSAVNVLPGRLSGVAVIDPTAFALRVLGLMVATGLPLPRSAPASG
jgi:allantoin racemase